MTFPWVVLMVVLFDGGGRDLHTEIFRIRKHAAVL